MIFLDKHLNTIPMIPWDGNVNEAYYKTQIMLTMGALGLHKNVCLINKTEQYSSYEWFDTINKSDVDIVVINASEHPEYKFNETELSVIEKPYFILNSDFNQPDYYPFWMFASRAWETFSYSELSTKRLHNVSMLCYKSRIPRIYALLGISKKSYYSELQLTWGDIDTESSSELVSDIMVNVNSSVPMEFDNFEHGIEQFIELHKIINRTNPYLKVDDIRYGMGDAYLQIVLESRPECNGFISEKIFKPIRAGQLFLVQGSVGTVAKLKQMGFDTFDDFIDHSIYDSEPNWALRTTKMLGVLDNIYNDIGDIYFSTIDRRQRNIDLLKSPQIYDYGTQHIRDSINTLSAHIR